MKHGFYPCVDFIICDVIWENTAYGGANSVSLDQPFPYILIHRLFLSCAESKKVFSAYTHVWQKAHDLIRRSIEGAAPVLSVPPWAGFPR